MKKMAVILLAMMILVLPNALIAADLELQSWHWYVESRESHHFLWVKGEVKNISSSPIKWVEAVCSLYDSQGNFIDRVSGWLDYNPILANQISPFSIVSTGNPKIKIVKIGFVRDRTAQISWVEKKKTSEQAKVKDEPKPSKPKAEDWYVIKIWESRCAKLSEDGTWKTPADCIEAYQTLQKPYSVTDDKVENGKVVQVTVNDLSDYTFMTFYYGVDRCKEALKARKTKQEKELERYK